ncbi:MAG: hypothetical protein AAGD23_08940 [Pseudomonadota bacterium]
MASNLFKAAAVAGVALLATGHAQATEGPHVGPIKEYVNANVMSWLSDPAVVSAIKAQNDKTAGMSAAQIEEMDQKWRAETGASDRPMIEGILANDLSAFLKDKKNAAAGMITEMFVMDAKGLNVGQSDVTSDYWQGDEAKWQKTYKVGPNAIFVDEIEKDESTQTLQSQVSVSITDESGAPIGAITLGINVDAL